MSTNDLILRYDGICIYATSIVKPSIAAKFILSFLNFCMLGIIVLFSTYQVFLAVFFFLIIELIVIRYTLWNLFGEERVIISAKSLSYQQHYGFFTTTLQTITLYKRISVLPYETITKRNQDYVKFLVQSYNESSLPEVIYHSVLHLNNENFDKLLQHIDRLFIDDTLDVYEMPAIHLN